MDGTPTIRAFAEADRGPVKEIWAACGLLVPYNDPDADISLAAGRAASDILVACLADGSVAASIMVGHDGHRGWLYYVAVDPARRGRGYGRAMVRAGEDWLRERGIRKAQLLIRESNAAVRAFYERIGWVESPRTVMERWLPSPGPGQTQAPEA